MPVDSNKVSSNLRSISRLNIALAVLALFAVVIVYLIMRSRSDEHAQQTNTNAGQNSNTTAQQVLPEPDIDQMEEDYEKQIEKIVGDYAFDDSKTVQPILDEVLELRTPPTYKDFHLQLVVALTYVQQSNYEEAQQRVHTLEEQYDWFTPATE